MFETGPELIKEAAQIPAQSNESLCPARRPCSVAFPFCFQRAQAHDARSLSWSGFDFHSSSEMSQTSSKVEQAESSP